MKKVRILSWNVNGIRAAHKKNFLPWLAAESPDILCVQETKALPSQLSPELQYPPGYRVYWNSAERLGYSGVAVFSKEEPLKVKKEPGTRLGREGRWLELDYEEFTLINIYFPNGKRGDDRLKYKMDFYDEALKYFIRLKRKGRRLAICGDYNTAHKEIDLSNPKQNEDVSGFLPEERAWMDKLAANGFIDTFRFFHPGEPGHYTWWDLRSGARLRNIGWRLDYHFISQNLQKNLKEALHLTSVMGSDHCPAEIVLEV